MSVIGNTRQSLSIHDLAIHVSHCQSTWNLWGISGGFWDPWKPLAASGSVWQPLRASGIRPTHVRLVQDPFAALRSIS
eukprot:5110148-Karenia_brevis.AAC.1